MDGDSLRWTQSPSAGQTAELHVSLLSQLVPTLLDSHIETFGVSADFRIHLLFAVFSVRHSIFQRFTVFLFGSADCCLWMFDRVFF